MNIKLTLIAALLILAGCDKVVSVQQHPDRAFTRKTTQSCNAGPGYCCEYGYSNGKYQYSCGMHMSCDGEQPVTQHVIPETVRYESGKLWESETSTTISVDGECH